LGAGKTNTEASTLKSRKAIGNNTVNARTQNTHKLFTDFFHTFPPDTVFTAHITSLPKLIVAKTLCRNFFAMDAQALPTCF